MVTLPQFAQNRVCEATLILRQPALGNTTLEGYQGNARVILVENKKGHLAVNVQSQTKTIQTWTQVTGRAR